jgi:hypothetical protein
MNDGQKEGGNLCLSLYAGIYRFIVSRNMQPTALKVSCSYDEWQEHVEGWYSLRERGRGRPNTVMVQECLEEGVLT